MKRLLTGCLLWLILPGTTDAQTVPFTSSNLPIVLINTGGQSIPDDPKIEADMDIIFNGDGIRNNVPDPPNGDRKSVE